MYTRKRTYIMHAVCCLMVIVSAVMFGGCGHDDNGSPPPPTVDNSKISGTFTVTLVDATTPATDYGTMTFDGAGNGLYTSLASSNSNAFTYSVTVLDNELIIDSTIGTLNNAGNFFAGIDLNNGAETMIIGIKQASLFTDTTGTYRGGMFELTNNFTPSAHVSEMLFTTHETGTGGLLVTNLTSGSTGTLDYTIAPNGTFTIGPGPDILGAISGDNNFFMFSSVGGGKDMLSVALKYPSTGMTSARLNGTYRIYESWYYDSTGFGVTRSLVTFYGNGTGARTVLQDSGGASGTDAFTYTVASDGSFVVNGTDMKGFVLEDGSALVLSDDNPNGDITSAIGIKD